MEWASTRPRLARPLDLPPCAIASRASGVACVWSHTLPVPAADGTGRGSRSSCLWRTWPLDDGGRARCTVAPPLLGVPLVVEPGRSQVLEDGDLDQPVRNRVPDQLAPVVDIQLLHEVVLVHLGRLHAAIEARRDLLDGEPVRQQLEHLALAVGQEVVAGAVALDEQPAV